MHTIRVTEHAKSILRPDVPRFDTDFSYFSAPFKISDYREFRHAAQGRRSACTHTGMRLNVIGVELPQSCFAGHLSNFDAKCLPRAFAPRSISHRHGDREPRDARQNNYAPPPGRRPCFDASLHHSLEDAFACDSGR